jgi:hypothetical protein
MADRVLFIGWNRAIPGRENQAMQLFQKSIEFYSQLQNESRIERYESVLLGAHGGDLNGFILLYGSTVKLAELREDKKFVEFVIEGGFCIDGFGIVPGYTGQGLVDMFSQYSKLIGG